jgi:hypothetical protein
MLCLCLLLTAVGCSQKSTAASSSSVASSSASQSAVSASSSAPQSQSTSASSDKAVSSSSASDAEINTKDWPLQFVSIPIAGSSEKALIILRTPLTWNFDDNYTFFNNDIKIAEVAAVYPISDPDFPFTEEIIAPYADSTYEFPEGYGLLSTSARMVNGNSVLTYLYKTWPDDADHPWYPHYSLMVMDDYVVAMHFYSLDEKADDAVFDAVLGSIELHLRMEDTSSSAQ